MNEVSIGPVVHYVAYGTFGGEYSKACRAAILTQKNLPSEEGCQHLGLAVLNPSGMFFHPDLPEAQLQNNSGEIDVAGGTWHPAH